MTDNLSDRVTDILTPAEAAVRLGVSERTVWRRIKAGKLQAEHSPDGVRVVLTDSASDDDSQLTVTVSQVSDRVTDTPQQPPEQMDRALDLIERMHEDQRSEIERLRQENDRLFEAARFWQSRAIQAEDQVKLLMAPKEDELTDVTPTEAPAEPGPDWQAIAQTLEERVKRLEEPPAQPEPVKPWWKRLFG